MTFASLISVLLDDHEGDVARRGENPGALSLPMSAFRLVKRCQRGPEVLLDDVDTQVLLEAELGLDARFVYMPARTMMIRYPSSTALAMRPVKFAVLPD